MLRELKVLFGEEDESPFISWTLCVDYSGLISKIKIPARF
jgi:hypothetical protein